MYLKAIRKVASLTLALGVVAAPSWALEVEVISSFPELVTGGDALVKVTGTTRRT